MFSHFDLAACGSLWWLCYRDKEISNIHPFIHPSRGQYSISNLDLMIFCLIYLLSYIHIHTQFHHATDTLWVKHSLLFWTLPSYIRRLNSNFQCQLGTVIHQSSSSTSISALWVSTRPPFPGLWDSLFPVFTLDKGVVDRVYLNPTRTASTNRGSASTRLDL